MGVFPKTEAEFLKYSFPSKQPHIKGVSREYLQIHWALNDFSKKLQCCLILVGLY